MITVIFTTMFYFCLTYSNVISSRATNRINNMWYSIMWKMDIIINQILLTVLSAYIILNTL